ncbi:hypothetical protein EJ05DRAFT_534618 [Pseudovirgaria hyperparasitica]|uniref:Stress-response A/B barrel domain-containing protein n=1 Tax=Pseudovirgaria hyperparasitica TaxID=470096 RepID=A0A6A6WM47_9PEZI|nr:uncharacterized protein EJ05DRAFT_534618 [Pseudovirgaria hyperparasitica]KAF2763232.1 hypothetical protein EJ05DRAFT_534618 [Pseudovirgaria hyperparasitica]
MSAPHIDRIVLFKIPPQHIDTVIQAYTTMRNTARKSDKPYIIRAFACRLHTNTPSHGFTVAAQTRFANAEDVMYYNEQCEAHAKLKGIVAPLIDAPSLADGMLVVAADGNAESEGVV